MNGTPRKLRFLAILGVILPMTPVFGIFPAASLAGDDGIGVVEERRLVMKSMDAAAKRITEMMLGREAYDPQALAAAARLVASHGGSRLTRQFPEGSLESPSKASPKIWADWKRFESLAQDLELFGEGLAQAVERRAGPGTQRLPATVRPDYAARPLNTGSLSRQPPKLVYLRLLRTCMSCHADFRGER